jgi:D-serine deaminase-like pyridoxal phosphate-dependent protein
LREFDGRAALMARRFENGAMRTAPPRRKDVTTAYTAPEPDRNRDASGRFVGGNDAAKRKAIRSLLKRQLGAGATTEEVEQLYRETMVQFRALLADLPAADAAEVQDLTARRARWGVLSARYASKAAEVGLFTDEGAKLLDVALKLDARAERLAVTARDEAERLHAARPRQNATATAIARIIGDGGKP